MIISLMNRNKRYAGHVSATAGYCAIVSGFFGLMLFFLLLSNYVQLKKINPGNFAVLEEIKLLSMQNPSDAVLADKARRLDYLVRRSFFNELLFSKTGSLILLGAFVVFIASLKVYVIYKTKIGAPAGSEETERFYFSTAESRRWLYFISVMILFFSLVIIRKQRQSWKNFANIAEANVKENAKGVVSDPQVKSMPSEDDLRKNWPSFLGYMGSGSAYGGVYPVEWDAKSGKNIVWKVGIPRPGFNSPLVWEDRIFMTGANKDSRDVYCFSAKDGSLLWTGGTGIENTGPEPEVMDDTGYAAPTAALDGRYVCAIFANGDLVCHSIDGKRLWSKNIGVSKNPYGYASSPIILGDLLIVQFDQDESSFTAAFNVRDGSEKWRTERDTISCWSSPLPMKVENRIVLAMNGNPFSGCYDATDGKLTWSVDCSTNDLSISPAFNGKVLVLSVGGSEIGGYEFPAMKELWRIAEEVPDVPTPLALKEQLVTATSAGTVCCIDINDGRKLWSHSFDEGFYSSPAEAAGNIYLTDRSGYTYVFKAGGDYVPVAENSIGEPCVTVPAFSNGKIFIRGQDSLFCIEGRGAGN